MIYNFIKLYLTIYSKHLCSIMYSNSNIYLYIFPALLVQMICGGIILALLIIENNFEESDFMLSCCISLWKKVIILSELSFSLIPFIIINDMPFRMPGVRSSFLCSFVDLFIGTSIFVPIFSVTSKFLSVLALLKSSSLPSDCTSNQPIKCPIDSYFEFRICKP